MKKFLWALLCVVLSIVTFVVSFLAGIIVPSVKYGSSLAVEWNEDVGEIVTDLKFGGGEGTSYDLYIPKKLREDKDASLILFIHGGSFTGGSKIDEDMWCKYYAAQGYITATLDYSLMSEGSSVNINTMNEEIFLCVKAIKDECLSRGYDIKQMATSGQSAGGHLAMLYAYSHGMDSPIPVKFVFQQTGPCSFHIEDWGGDAVTEAEYDGVISAVLGWAGKEITKDQVADGSYLNFLNEISPVSLVNENTVPTLCAYGANDVVVPVNMKYKLFEAFEKYGVKYDFIYFENSGHGMTSDADKQAEFIEKSLEYCDKYFE